MVTKFIFSLVLLFTMSAQANPEPESIIGTYHLNVQLGENTFIDILKIDEIKVYNQPIYSVAIKGSFESPNLFKVPFQGIYFPLRKLINGHFTIDEGRGPQKIRFDANQITEQTLEGQLSIEGQIIGTFEGSKVNGEGL